MLYKVKISLNPKDIHNVVDANLVDYNISHAKTIHVEIPPEMMTLTKEQSTILKDLFIHASWEKTKTADIATTDYIAFDNDLLIGILVASDHDLTIMIGRSRFLLTNVNSNIYSIFEK